MFSLDCQLTFKHQRWYNFWEMKFNIVAQNWQVVWIQNSLLNPPLYSVYCTLENLDHLTGRISCRTSINLEIAKFNCHFRDLFYNLDLLKIISISCLVGVQVFESSYVRPRTGSLKGNCIMITQHIPNDKYSRCQFYMFVTPYRLINMLCIFLIFYFRAGYDI